MNGTNLELYNMKYRGSIESLKYNNTFEAIDCNIKNIANQLQSNTTKLLSNAQRLLHENQQLNNKLRYLENKVRLINNYIQRGL